MKLFSFILILFSFLIFAGSVFALNCTQLPDKETIPCKFGTISPPSFIQQFIGADDTGATGISKFLSNLIVLIYSIATIVLIFMILWGAFEWLVSGGDKEAIAKARGRIFNAIIGIILFALAFAIIEVIGTFTGFTFFAGQNTNKPVPPVSYDEDKCKAYCGGTICTICLGQPTRSPICGVKDPNECNQP